jgi:predicted GH43/DUF377 family glycosyl hydrolase
MYFGGSAVHLATSDDLTNWKPLEDRDGAIKSIMKPRKGFFDCTLTEVGPQAILTNDGIVVFFNGCNGPRGKGDPSIGSNAYCGGQALFDTKDPTKLIARLDKPYIQPDNAWEKTGLFKDGTTFTEGLVLFHDQWFIYFGCADSVVGAASAPLNAKQVVSAPSSGQ